MKLILYLIIMSEIRRIEKIMKSWHTLEGAGVHLKRVFSNREVKFMDPFLLLDHFGSNDPADYLAGFPWHPHRGIETVTYMLNGIVEHGDSIGNSGAIKSGDVQWMTAGSGIIHQEMPKKYEGLMSGFQLWVNLPAKNKMMNPRYRDVKSATIPEVSVADGVKIKVISGKVKGTKGPVEDIVVDPEYLDVMMEPDTEFEHHVHKGYTAFAYVIAGHGYFGPDKKELITPEHLVVFKDGDMIKVQAGDQDFRFLLISGKPIGEPIAWYGPIVMNTQKELELAFEEYRNGTFIKNK
jgi:redox-sensitive bicupin YhaK (pirin superfamily)